MKNGIVVAAAFVAWACTCDKSEPAMTSASAAASGAPVAIAAPSAAPLNVQPSSWPVPTGLRLAILAGKGVGPIRFGATVQTIERLMDLPCEIRTEDACRYIGRAIEFMLKDGVAVEMRLHRVDRSAGDGRSYGVFNGRTPEGVAFMMLPTGVEELLGAPQKTEAAKEPGERGTVEVREYPGMRLEFDRLPTGKIVLGGIVLTKADVKEPTAPPKALRPLH
jgi:hypothetical protein